MAGQKKPQLGRNQLLITPPPHSPCSSPSSNRLPPRSLFPSGERMLADVLHQQTSMAHLLGVKHNTPARSGKGQSEAGSSGGIWLTRDCRLLLLSTVFSSGVGGWKRGDFESKILFLRVIAAVVVDGLTFPYTIRSGVPSTMLRPSAKGHYQ